MNEEEKKAIKDFREDYEKDLSRYDDFNSYTQIIIDRNGIILNLIEKQSKAIDEMADYLQDNLSFSPLNGMSKEELKQYFLER